VADSTTTAAAEEPSNTTTEEPSTTTTEEPSTTTTEEPSTTTTEEPSTTSTEGPSTTTTEEPSTTTTEGPSTTTTAGGNEPTVEDVSLAIDPDDGADHHAHSIQVSTDAKLQLTWSTNNATGVRIDPLPGPFDASGSTDIPTSDATYSIVALGDGGAESMPYSLEIHTHEPGDVVSQHVDVSSGVAKILSFTATVDGEPVDSAAAGASVVLTVIASVDTDSAKAGDQDVTLADGGDGQKTGTVTVTIPSDGDASVTYTCEAAKDGATADTSTITLAIEPVTTTTAAPSSTTTGPSTTTTGPSTTTTAPSTTTTALDDSALQNPTWGAAAYSHGQPIQLTVDAVGVEDGRVVYFAIEQDDGDGNWQPLQEAQAAVSGGKATTQVMIDDPGGGDAGTTTTAAPSTATTDPDGSGPASGEHEHKFRFTASFTSSGSQ
jgi:hypothetical protein